MIYISQMPRLLFSPKKAFTNMVRARGKTGFTAAVLVFTLTQLGIMGLYLMSGYPLSAFILAQALFGIVAAIMFFSMTVYLASYFAWLFGGRRDFNMSYAYMGHATILNLVQQMSVALVAFLNGIIYYPFAPNSSITGAIRSGPGLESFTAMAFAVSIIFFVWQIWVNGNALRAANKTTLARGMFSYVLAAVVMGFIIGLITSILIVAAFAGGHGLTILRFTPF